MKGRRGFTLIEMLIVITIVGVLLAVLVPRYGKIAAGMNVHSAKQEIASMLSQARATAVQSDRTVQVIRTSNVISLYTINGLNRTVVSQQDMGAQFGVTVTDTKDTVAYDSRGQIAGNTVTLKWVVTNGTTRDSVCVMALGTISRSGCAL